MAAFKAKVIKGTIRYYKDNQKVTVREGEECEFDRKQIYDYFIDSGCVEALEEKPKKKTSKKKEEEKPVEDAE